MNSAPMSASSTLLGILLLKPECFEELERNRFEEMWLEHEWQRTMYRILCQLRLEGGIQQMGIVERWPRKGMSESDAQVLALEHITGCMDCVSSTVLLPDAIKEVRRSYERREMRRIATETMTILGQGNTPAEVRSWLQAELRALEQNIEDPEELHRRAERIKQRYMEVAKHYRETGEIQFIGIPMPLPELNELFPGGMPMHVNTLAARPGSGKTSLAHLIAYHAAVNGYPVELFSIEMTADEVIERMFSQQMRVDLINLRTGRMTKEDEAKFEQFKEALQNLPLRIHGGRQTINHIVGSMWTGVEKRDAQLMVIDYLQIIRQGPRAQASRYAMFTEFMDMIVDTTSHLRVSTLLLSQLSREYLKNKKAGSSKTPVPKMHDLKETGGIEQDSYTVSFLYPDPDLDDDEIKSLSQVPTIIDVQKFRGGPSNKHRKVYFTPAFCLHERMPSRRAIVDRQVGL